MGDYAIYYESSAFTLEGKVMGRQSAGATFLKAIANAKPPKVWCYARTRKTAAELAGLLSDAGSPRTGVAWVPFDQPQLLAQAGLLYRPDPGIQSDAWLRLSGSVPDAYSICGITHTTASHAVMERIAGLVTAPLESWDALICTSRSVRDSVRTLIENQADYLRERIGATKFSLPQLPVIPLGVHTDRFTASSEDRTVARSHLNIAPDETVFLFAGRLSFHGKAHPLPMFQALEANSKHAKIVLIQAGWFATPGIEQAFKSDAAQVCPSIRCIYVDGRDQQELEKAYFASDIFTSLSDNIQETFGITPIEAMAAGLPVVVSDWDGYRDTVRNGIDGFRIPTLSLPAGRGGELVDRYDLGLDDYDRYCAYSSQLVAVDVEQTATAYNNLITNPGLRFEMGSNGARRARETYDWSKIFCEYTRLWDELGERRRSDARLSPSLSRRRRSERSDPFTMFATYPTSQIGSDCEFRKRQSSDAETAILRKELETVSFAKAMLPSDELIKALFEFIGNDWEAYNDIIQNLPNTQLERTASALVWLTKMGCIDYRRITIHQR